MKKKQSEILFQVARLIAESDSIGEGYNYCKTYTKKDHADVFYDEYRALAQEIINLIQNNK